MRRTQVRRSDESNCSNEAVGEFLRRHHPSFPQKGETVMKIQDGDVLIGKAGEYDIELTVTKVCKGDVCWTECDADLVCNGQPLVPVSAGKRLSERRPGR
jgi:hypothetical protein